MTAKSSDVRRAAMDMLARREHARGELVTKLGRRFKDTAEVIEAEIDKLTAEGLQSDFRLAEAFLYAKSRRGQGPMKIKAGLRSRGVSDDVIAEAFGAAEVDWYSVATEVAVKRFGAGGPLDQKERARRSRFLQQRGFSFDHISPVLSLKSVV